MVKVLAHDTKCRVFDSWPFHFQVTTLGKLFTHMCLGQGAVTPCGWEGNRRFGFALAMRHRLHCFIHLRAHILDNIFTAGRQCNLLMLICRSHSYANIFHR